MSILFSIGQSLTITPIGGGVLLGSVPRFTFLISGGQQPYQFSESSTLPPEFGESWTFTAQEVFVQFTAEYVTSGSLSVTLAVTDARGVRKSATITFIVVDPLSSTVLGGDPDGDFFTYLVTENGTPIGAA